MFPNNSPSKILQEGDIATEIPQKSTNARKRESSRMREKRKNNEEKQGEGVEERV